MRALGAAVMVLLASCQIIINHNELTAGDATGSDAAPDSELEPASIVRSTASSGVRLVTAFVDPAGTLIADGNWITSATPTIAGDRFRYALSYTGFTAPPNCACTTVGGNNHGCFLTNVGTSSATATVFNLPGEVQGRQIYVMCAGPSADAVAGRVTSAVDATMLLGTLRYDRTSVGSPVVLEDGAWVGAATPGNPPFPLPLDPVFAAPPNCNCTMTFDGNPGATASNCKLESPTTSTVQLSETANSGPGNPVAHDLICSGRAVEQLGSFVVATRADGLVLASATIDGASNTPVRSDGSWIQSVSGGAFNTVTFAAGTFGAPPRCLCTAVDTDGVACHVVEAPAAGGLEVVATAPVDGPSSTIVESDFSLLCFGPTP